MFSLYAHSGRNSQLIIVLLAIFSILSVAQQVARPGGVEDIIVTAENTLNSTGFGNARVAVAKQYSSAGQLDLSFINNLNSNAVNAYVTGLDRNGFVVLLKADGSYYYPPGTSSGVPQPIAANVSIPLGPPGSTTNITLPDYLSAGRIWFADGILQFSVVAGGTGTALVQPSAADPKDPNAAVNWGFVELTNIANGGLYANLSFVDFVGMALGMTITATNGAVQSAFGVSNSAVTAICRSLIAQTACDGQAWSNLCVIDSSGRYLRALAPALYLSTNSSAFKGYWDDYVNQVWAYYKTNKLTIDTQTAPGKVNCTVTNSVLNCIGDNRGYIKPNALDIFGCNTGPFSLPGGDNLQHYATVPRLCAAFDRTTLLLPGGNIQPSLDPSFYYTQAPTNWYSAFVHENEVDGKGYAFSYDDVTPSGQEDQSGLLAMQNPALMQIYVGGRSPQVPISSSTTTSTTTTTTSTTHAATATVAVPRCNTKYVAAIKKKYPRKPRAFCAAYKPKVAGSRKSPVNGIPNVAALVKVCKCFVKQQDAIAINTAAKLARQKIAAAAAAKKFAVQKAKAKSVSKSKAKAKASRAEAQAKAKAAKKAAN